MEDHYMTIKEYKNNKPNNVAQVILCDSYLTGIHKQIVILHLSECNQQAIC